MRVLHRFASVSILCTFILMGCASIVSRSTYPLAINTDPTGADVSIRNKAGVEIYRGLSPAVVDLKAGAGYFSRETYTLTINKEGYKDRIIPVNFTLDGWYFGNILFGGLIGILIVDPITGAMWKIERSYINTVLDEIPASGQAVLKIYDIAEVPDEWRRHMMRIE